MSISMLDEKLPILIRETLGDDGTTVCRNASPDIIVRKNKYEEEIPTRILTETYGQDISLESDDSGKMYLYVRFKNISAQPLTDFYIHLYRNHLGLANLPGDWSKFEMHTEAGTPAFIEYLGAGKIGATPAFVYDKATGGAHPNCFVVVATREKNPDYSSICNGDTYIRWVNKQNVAARNICVIPGQSGIHRQTIIARNPFEKPECQMLLYVTIEQGTPSGISYGIRQEALHINEKRTYIESDARTNSITCSFPMSPGKQIPFEIWFEANKRDSSYIKCTSNFYEKKMYISDPALDRYLVDLRTGLAISDGAGRFSETSDYGYLLGCCYLKGDKAE